MSGARAHPLIPRTRQHAHARPRTHASMHTRTHALTKHTLNHTHANTRTHARAHTTHARAHTTHARAHTHTHSKLQHTRTRPARPSGVATTPARVRRDGTRTRTAPPLPVPLPMLYGPGGKTLAPSLRRSRLCRRCMTKPSPTSVLKPLNRGCRTSGAHLSQASSRLFLAATYVAMHRRRRRRRRRMLAWTTVRMEVAAAGAGAAAAAAAAAAVAAAEVAETSQRQRRSCMHCSRSSTPARGTEWRRKASCSRPRWVGACVQWY